MINNAKSGHIFRGTRSSVPTHPKATQPFAFVAKVGFQELCQGFLQKDHFVDFQLITKLPTYPNYQMTSPALTRLTCPASNQET
jgi:hypothetical protein